MANVSSSNGLEKRPKLRFPGFDEPWRAEKLSDFAERVTRKNSNNETDLPLTISSKDGLVDQISYFNKTVASKDMSGYYLLRNGEYAYNKSYSVGYDFGSIKRLDRYPMGALSTLYICFALKKHDTDFIKVYFDSLKWYKEIYMISAEGARNHGLLNVPTDEMSIRRINFYKRLNFTLHEKPYMQPPYRTGDSGLPMLLMTYGDIDMEKDFDKGKNMLYKEVYGQPV